MKLTQDDLLCLEDKIETIEASFEQYDFDTLINYLQDIENKINISLSLYKKEFSGLELVKI